MGRSAQGFFWIWEWFRNRGLDFSSEPTEIKLSEIKDTENKGTDFEEMKGSNGTTACEGEQDGTRSVRISLCDGTMKGSVSAIRKKLEEQSIVLSQSGDILSIGLKGEPCPQFLIVNEFDVELADLLSDEESEEDEVLDSWMSGLIRLWTTKLVPADTPGDAACSIPPKAKKMKGRSGRCLVVYVLNRDDGDPMPVYRRWPLVHYHLIDKIQMPDGVRDFHENRDGVKARLKKNVRITRRRSI